MSSKKRFIVYLLLFSAGVLQASVCKLKPGLYQERRRIQRRYALEVGNDYLGHKVVADILEAEMSDVNRRYFEYMVTVYRSKREEDTGVCCAAAKEDLIAKQICTLARYVHAQRKNPDAFLMSVPDDKESADALWSLDEIASYSQRAETTLPFGPNGPVSQYLGELFELVVGGDPHAIRKYLGLYSFADGDNAEFMEAQLEALFLQHPRIVISNWRSIRDYTDLLSTMRGAMSEDTRREASSRIRNECVRESRECDDILAHLR